MKILLVGNYLNDRWESMNRFAALMQTELTQAGHEAEVVRPAALAGRLRDEPRGVGKWLGYLDKFVVFPFLFGARVRWADVVHICDHSNAMYSYWCRGTPCVVTCHDMLAVRGSRGEQTDCPASWTGRWLQRWIVCGLRNAARVISVSMATAADAEEIVGGPAAARRVILNGLNYPYQRIPRAEALRRLSHREFDATRPFVLHVGSNEPRKNRQGVIRIFAQASRQAELQLVFAGKPLTRELEELARSQGIAGRITVLTELGNEELEALYNLALALLFPSRFEGFGWPLIEAQACGCPVLCSRCAPFAEVVGDSAIVRDVEDEGGFADEIVRLAGDAGECERWVERGLGNAQRFAPREMLAGYLEVYEELVAKR